MSEGLYELIALAARYVFAALMVLIVLRAWRITIIDSRRASMLRRMSPQTGLSGELLVLDGEGKARRGMRYPVIREGMIGSFRRSDIRIRHASIRRKHAYFQLTPRGLTIQARPGAPMLDADGRPAETLLLTDGSEFTLGEVRLLLILTDGGAMEKPDVMDEPEPGYETDDLFLEDTRPVQ
jgi:hypothetical protein